MELNTIWLFELKSCTMSRTNRIFPIITFSFLLIFGSCKNETNQTGSPQNIEDSQLEEVTPDSQNPALESAQQQELQDLIQVEIPEPDSVVSSPQEIRGKARGTWFFEGDFAVYLLDENGDELGVVVAIAQGEWMTTEWVDFTATMDFDVLEAGRGYLVFEKSNPSDKRELDRELRFPVIIEP